MARNFAEEFDEQVKTPEKKSLFPFLKNGVPKKGYAESHCFF